MVDRKARERGDIGYMEESDLDAFEDEDPDLLTEYFDAEDSPSKRER